MPDKITITLPPGASLDDIERLCRGISQWCAWAADHDLTQPVSVTVAGGPPMNTAEFLDSVHHFVPTQLADKIQVERAGTEYTETSDGSRRTGDENTTGPVRETSSAEAR